MNKTVDRERILAAIHQTARYKKAETDRCGEVAQAMARLGSSYVFQTLTPTDFDRAELDLALQGVSSSDWNEIDGTMSRFTDLTRQRDRWRERIWKIQVAHGISGLVPKTTYLGDLLLSHHWMHDDLELTPADLEQLTQEIPEVVQLMIEYSQSQGLRFYRYALEDELVSKPWLETHAIQIRSSMAQFQWAKTWEHRGRDRHEVYLLLGTGTSDATPDTSAYYCASNRVPPL